GPRSTCKGLQQLPPADPPHPDPLPTGQWEIGRELGSAAVYSPTPRRRCHQPLRAGCSGGAGSGVAVPASGPTTTRSMTGSLATGSVRGVRTDLTGSACSSAAV